MSPARTLLVALFASGCAVAPLDRSVSRGPVDTSLQVSDVPVRGFRVSVETRGADVAPVDGELLAVDRLHVWVARGWEVVALHRDEVARVTVTVLDDEATGLGLGVWTGLGAASTLSHGYYLLLSAPVWLGLGVPLTVYTSAQNRARFDKDLGGLWQFARFPQGLPAARWTCDAHAPIPGDGVPGPWEPPPALPPEEPEAPAVPSAPETPVMPL